MIRIGFILFLISLNTLALNEQDVRSYLEDGIQKCRKYPKDDLLYGVMQQSLDVLKKAKIFSHKGTILVSDEPAVLVVPLFDENKNFIDLMIFSAKTEKPLFWPLTVTKEPVIPVFGSTVWIKLLGQSNNFSEEHFLSPVEGINQFPVHYPCIQNGLSRRVLGIPFNMNWKQQAGFIEHSDSYFKNIHETEKQIAYLNKTYGTAYRNIPGTRATPSKCLYASVASLCDWWNICEGGGKASAYTAMFSGDTEYGLNPRIIEALYKKYSQREPEKFPFVDRKLYVDAVTEESVPDGLLNVCETVCRKGDGYIRDPSIPKIHYRFSEKDFGVQYHCVKLSDTEMKDDAKIMEYLENNGPILAGLRYFHIGIPVKYTTHCVIICGAVKTHAGIFYVYKEPFGNFPEDYGSRDDGDVSFRMLQKEYFSEMYVFPHTLKAQVKKEKNGFFIKLCNWRGIEKKADIMEACSADGKKLTITETIDGYRISENQNPIIIRWHRKHYCEPLKYWSEYEIK